MPLPLVHTPARIMAQLLVDLAVAVASVRGGTQPDWASMFDGEQSSPNEMVVCADTSGVILGVDAHGGVNEHYGVQIKVRAGTVKVSGNKAQAIATALDALRKTGPRVVTVRDYTDTVDSTYCVGQVRRTGPPVRMGPETNSTRRSYAINVLMAVTQQA